MLLPPNRKSGLVWIVSGLFLLLYSSLGLLGWSIPGVEELLALISETSEPYFYLAAFFITLLEGIYLVGNFIPGSTIMMLMVAFSETLGLDALFLTTSAIFLGWSIAGAINIYLTKKIMAPKQPIEILTRDRLFTTWYPAFRANYEVAQIMAGAKPLSVFIASIRVKFLTSLAMAIICLILPYFLDINELSNSEGFFLVVCVALISISVGVWQWLHPKPNVEAIS